MNMIGLVEIIFNKNSLDIFNTNTYTPYVACDLRVWTKNILEFSVPWVTAHLQQFCSEYNNPLVQNPLRNKKKTCLQIMFFE